MLLLSMFYQIIYPQVLGAAEGFVAHGYLCISAVGLVLDFDGYFFDVQLIWDRALGLPIERPKSMTFEYIENFCKSKEGITA